MSMNLIGEIAQFAVETDQIIKQLAKERDDYKHTVECMERELRDSGRRIVEGKAENERLRMELQSVRNPDGVKERI